MKNEQSTYTNNNGRKAQNEAKQNNKIQHKKLKR